jgi:hypothetical protein
MAMAATTREEIAIKRSVYLLIVAHWCTLS